jgi:hypothetical protein
MSLARSRRGWVLPPMMLLATVAPLFAGSAFVANGAAARSRLVLSEDALESGRSDEAPERLKGGTRDREFRVADSGDAQNYLKEARDLVARRDFNAASAKLELAEAELDDAADKDKPAIKAAIDELRQQIAGASAAADKPKYQRLLGRAMGDAEQAIGNVAAWPRAEEEFNEISNDAAARAALGPEFDAAAKKFATFKRLHTKKAAAQIEAEVDKVLKAAEEHWAESKAKLAGSDTDDKDEAIENTEHDIADVRKRMARLAPDDERRKEFAARLDKVAGEFAKLALADRVKEVVERLKRSADDDKAEWEGYEKEAGGLTWDRYSKESSQPVSAFLAPRTRAFVRHADDLLSHLNSIEDYEAVQSDPAVRAIVDDLKAKRDAAYAKLVKFITPVVEGAAKSGVKDGDAVEQLKADVRVALGEDSPEGAAFIATLEGKLAANTGATTAAEEAKVKLVAMLREKAEAAWPRLHEGMSFDTQFDLTKPEKLNGKYIGFNASNLMGFRFNPGDFYFATTLGGVPVAGRIDPRLMKQIDATEKAIGRGLGHDDGDGKWEVIAKVTESKVKLMARRQLQGTGRVENLNVKYSGEYAEPVDAVVIDIVAAKIGPFAGGKDRGVLKEDGTIVK